jgi:hypothetical protein
MSKSSNSKQKRKSSRSPRRKKRILNVVGIANKKEMREGAAKIPGKALNDKCELIPTSGEVLRDGSFLEPVRDSATGAERLLHWSRGRSKIAPEHVFEGCCYVPTQGAAILRHLPSEPTPYGSTENLFEGVCEFAAKSLAVTEDEAALLAYFCFASYFCDCLTMSPCLVLFGPFCLAAIPVLRFLGCICRHSVLLAESTLHGLPRELRPTRLICQPDPGLNKLLAALQFPGFGISDRGLRQVSGAAAIYVGDMELKSLFGDAGVWIPVSPMLRSFSTQDEEREVATINNLQNRLLMYRLQNFAQVRSSQFDAPEFCGSTREMARALGRCIVDAADLQARFLNLLNPRDDAERTEGTRRLEAVVVEALVVVCHEKSPSVHVGQVADLANAILSRSGESFQLSPKEVGAKMKHLGFRTTRLDFAGRGIYLLTEQCALIHKLGRAFGVPTLREGLPGCPYCKVS